MWLKGVVALAVAGGFALAEPGHGHGPEPKEPGHSHKHDGHQHCHHDTVLSLLAEHEEFSTLAGLIKQAGLEEALSGEGPFTVFAPVNDAFSALPEATLDRLTAPAHRDELKAVLLGHVVKGKVAAGELKNGAVLETLAGTRLTVVRDGDRIEVNGAAVHEADLPGENGVVHAVERVILPAK